MNNHSAQYLPLVSESSASEGHQCDYELPQKTTVLRTLRAFPLREKLLLLVILLQASLFVVLMLNKNQALTAHCLCPPTDNLLYSPAQTALEYEVRSFTVGRENKTTIYQGVSEEANNAWKDLYDHTIMKIPRSEAALLPNKTYPIKDEPGYYLASLDVFHQIHCLNNIRRALHKDHFTDDLDLDKEHVWHCIDSIRQSLMCNADISVNVWQWSTELAAVVGHSSQAHSCKNFNKLRDWALERRLHDWIDFRLYVDDDLPTPPIIS